MDVLHGSIAMFEQQAIRTVTFEFGVCNIDTRTFMQDYWYFFKEMGMTLSRVTSSGYLHRINSYKEFMEQMTTINYVAKSN